MLLINNLKIYRYSFPKEYPINQESIQIGCIIGYIHHLFEEVKLAMFLIAHLVHLKYTKNVLPNT